MHHRSFVPLLGALLLVFAAGCGSSSSQNQNQKPPPKAPGAPTAVQATAGDAQATVSWTAPAEDGGAAIASYTVTASPGGATATVNAPSTQALVTGLTNGTSYTFTVTAKNSAGTSVASSPSAPVTPQAPVVATAPDAPTGVIAVGGNAQATLSWSAPANDGGSPVLRYTVTSNPGGLTATVDAPSTTGTVTGLTNGTSYTFTVVATNAAGDSAPSAPSNGVVPATVPDAPQNVVATAGNGTASVTWSAPGFNGGSAVTGYSVSLSDGQTTNVDANTTSASFSGVSNGTSYTFTVAASNAVGTGAGAASNPVTPAGPPDAPSNVTASAGDSEATVSWTAPFDQGSPLLSYTVTSSPGPTYKVSANETQARIPHLTNGTAYTFTVTATNALGTSSASTASSAVTPATITNLCAASVTAHESFKSTTIMQGCEGAVTFDHRADLCGPGAHVCTADEWRVGKGNWTPTQNYWTDDALNIDKFGTCGPNGCGSGHCFATRGTTLGDVCPSNSPMRVCGSQVDSSGNTCNYTGCGLDSTTPNLMFGGCLNNPTAGTLCCSKTQHYYVSNSGDDSNVGTSSTSPFKTLDRATQVAMSGDVIYAAPGVYSSDAGETFVPVVGAGVSLLGDEPGRGESQLADGGTSVTELHVTGISGTSFTDLVSTGVLVGNGGAFAGFLVDMPADNLNSGSGIAMDGDARIRNNTVVHAPRGGITSHSSGGAIVTGNDLEANGQGILCDSRTTGTIRVENNTIEANDAGVDVTASACVDLGDGDAGSIGNNAIACNASEDLRTQYRLSAGHDVWNHASPTSSSTTEQGVDIFFADGGANVTVNSAGAGTPITSCPDGITP